MTDGIEKEIAMCQLAVKSSFEVSWFNRIKELLNKYNLPLPSELFEKIPTKKKWKQMVNNAVHSVTETQWREDRKLKPSVVL